MVPALATENQKRGKHMIKRIASVVMSALAVLFLGVACSTGSADEPEAAAAEEAATASVSLTVEGMTCVQCVQNIENNVGDEEGVESVEVDLDDESARVEYDPDTIDPEQIAAAIEKLGFEAAVRD